MALFELHKETLNRIKPVPFKLERDIQNITENNLEEIFDLKLIKSEFQLKNLRIDTLAFDEYSKTFVIIEYKKDSSFSVVDQGYAYLSMVLNNQADCILEHNDRSNEPIKKSDVDWSQSRILFVAPSFNLYQRQAINFKDIPIELWEVRQYANNLVSYNRILSTDTTESIKTISKSTQPMQKVSEQIKIHTVERVLGKASDSVKSIFDSIREEIFQIDSNAEERPAKTMVGYYTDGRGLAWLNPQSTRLTLHLRKGKYPDKYGMIKPEGWGGYPVLNITEDDFDLSYIRGLIKKAYEY